MTLYVIKSTVPPPASHTTKLSLSFKIFGWIAVSVYTAAASGSEIQEMEDIPALRAHSKVAFFARSDQTAGTVRIYSIGVSSMNSVFIDSN